MESQDITLIIGSIAAAIASIIYSLKHVKKSNCLGGSCVQETTIDIEQQKDVVQSTEV